MRFAGPLALLLVVCGTSAAQTLPRCVASYLPTAPAKRSFPARCEDDRDRGEIRQLPEGVWIALRSSAEPPALTLEPTAWPAWPPDGTISRFGHQVAADPSQRARLCTELNDQQPDPCLKWFEQSDQRRAAIRKLLVRRYAWTGSAYRFATEIPPEYAKEFGPLSPQSVPRATPLSGEAGFAVLIPWAAFPPQSSLTLDSVRLELEGDNPFAIRLDLSRPKEYWHSSCRLPLSAIDDFVYVKELRPAFFLPQEAPVVDTVFAFGLPMAFHWLPAPQLNPRFLRQQARAVRLGPDEYVCGPLLRHRLGSAETAVASRIGGQEGDAIEQVEPDFRVAPLPPGGALVWSPPHLIPYGMGGGGTCGGTPVISYSIHHVLPLSGKVGIVYGQLPVLLTGAVRLGCNEGDALDFDVEADATLRIVTEYHRSEQGWKTCRFQWTGTKYAAQPCQPSPPPARRSAFYKSLREW